MSQHRRFYLRWIWANGWSELIGLGSTLGTGFIVFTHFAEGSLATTLAGALLLVGRGARRLPVEASEWWRVAFLATASLASVVWKNPTIY